VDELGFRGEWRRYQTLALEAFERDRAGGHRSTHLIAPPGSGKTLLGFEILRRLDRPALVLGARLVAWSAEGYGAPISRPRSGSTQVITPPTSVSALRGGYRTQIDPSAMA